MSYSVRRKTFNSVHIIQEGKDNSKGTEIVLEPVAKDHLYLWMGEQGKFYDEDDEYFQSINLTYQDAQLLLDTLQQVLKQIKDI